MPSVLAARPYLTYGWYTDHADDDDDEEREKNDQQI